MLRFLKIFCLILAASLMACASAVETPESLKALSFQQATGNELSTAKVFFQGDATWVMDPANPGTGSLYFKSTEPNQKSPFGGFLSLAPLTNDLGIHSWVGDGLNNYWTFFENGVNAIVCLWTKDSTYAYDVYLGINYASMYASGAWTPYGILKRAWVPSGLSTNNMEWMPFGDIGTATGYDDTSGWVSCSRLFITNSEGNTNSFTFPVTIVGEDNSTTQPADQTSFRETSVKAFDTSETQRTHAMAGNSDHAYPTGLSDMDILMIKGKGFLTGNGKVTKVEYQDTDSGAAWTNWPINTTDTTDSLLVTQAASFTIESTDANYGFWLRITRRSRRKTFLWVKTVNVAILRCPLNANDLDHNGGMFIRQPGAFETGATNNQCPTEYFGEVASWFWTKISLVTQDMIDNGEMTLDLFDILRIPALAELENSPIMGIACAVDRDDNGGVSNVQNGVYEEEWASMETGDWNTETMTDVPGPDNIYVWGGGVKSTLDGGQHDADSRNEYDCDYDIGFDIFSGWSFEDRAPGGQVVEGGDQLPPPLGW